MNMIKRTLALLSCAVLAASTGCGDSAKVKAQRKQVEISFSWWGNDARNKYTLEAVRKFERLHPEIKVNCSYSEWSGYEKRNRVWMISDTECDVMQINYGWLSEYFDGGNNYYKLRELSSTLDLSGYTDDELRYGTKEGVLYALPIAMNAETVYINKTMYDKFGAKVPETWDDLFAAAELMEPSGVYPLSATSKSMWLLLIAYAEQTQGKKILSEDGRVNFTADDFAVMIDFYSQLIDKKVFPLVEHYERIKLDNEEYAGAVAWVSDAKNYFGAAEEKGREIVIADYLKTNSSGYGEGWYAKPATMYAVSKNTVHPDEAGIFLDFLVNSSEMAELQGIEKGIPLSSKASRVLERDGVLKGLQYDASQKMEGCTLSELSPILENEAIIDDFFSASNDYIYQKASLNETASSFYSTINRD